MDIRFYKATPEASVEWPVFAPDSEPEFVLVALENTLDPDANNHTGFDFYGAYGSDGSVIDEWAADQEVEAVEKAALPSPLTFYPAPFNEA
jgi:hypothetical protein